MVARVDAKEYSGNNDGVTLTGKSRSMSHQKHYPHITTSFSGIEAQEWKALHAMAQEKGVSNREALERAIRRLAADVRDGKEIVWQPSKVAPRRPAKIHADVLDEVRQIGRQFGFRINVIVSTAIYRWLNNP